MYWMIYFLYSLSSVKFVIVKNIYSLYSLSSVKFVITKDGQPIYHQEGAAVEFTSILNFLVIIGN